jgi:hypothetical protein
MDHDLQEGEQKRGEKAFETEEKVVNTLPELAAETFESDKGIKREVGVVLDDERNEIIADNYDNIKESDNEEKSEQEKSEKREYSSTLVNNKIDNRGSFEKQVFEFNDSDQSKIISNTTLSLKESKEKIAENVNLDNISISQTVEKLNSNDEIVETIEIDETVVETPFEKTTFESISKTENYINEQTVKSLETDKITVQNLETDEITSTETVVTKKEATEISPDQTLIETYVFKGNKDKISKEMNVRSVEVKKVIENDVKDQRNIDSITKQETTTETSVDKTTVTTTVNDNSTINKVISVDSDKEDLVISQNQNEGSGDKSEINVIAVTEIREEKSQLTDNDDEELETSTPVTPEGEEDILITISKHAPELVPVIRDLKQASNKLDPIRNDLKHNLEHSTTTETEHDDKVEEDDLLQKADSVREEMIKEAEEEIETNVNQEVDQEGEIYYSDDESGSPPKRIKIEINWNDIYGGTPMVQSFFFYFYLSNYLNYLY